MNNAFNEFLSNENLCLFVVDGDCFAKESDDSIVVVTRPTNIVDYHVPESVVFDKYFKVATQEYIDDYFRGLCTERIKNIEGSCDSFSTFGLGCDYCRTSIPAGWYYFCSECHKDMCLLCKSETSEEIALSNGAKKYASRKDALNHCQQNHQLTKRNTIIGCSRRCDVCEENCEEGSYFVPIEGDTFDICLKCWDKVETTYIIESYGGKGKFEKCLISHMQNTRFGSMLDWKPILYDENHHIIFININGDSPLCGKFAASSMDDHGRRGYFIIDKMANIEQLAEKLNEYATDIAWQASGGWSKHYNAPIPRLMADFGCATHYG